MMHGAARSSSGVLQHKQQQMQQQSPKQQPSTPKHIARIIQHNSPPSPALSPPNPGYGLVIDNFADVTDIPPDKVDVVLRPSDPHSPAQVLRVSLKDPVRILKMSIMGSEGIIFNTKDLCFLYQGMSVSDAMIISDLPGVRGGSRIILDVFLRSGIPLTLPPLDNPALGSKIVVVDNGLSHLPAFNSPTNSARGSYTQTATKGSKASSGYSSAGSGRSYRESPRASDFYSPRKEEVKRKLSNAGIRIGNAPIVRGGSSSDFERDSRHDSDEDDGVIEVELSGDDTPDEVFVDPNTGVVKRNDFPKASPRSISAASAVPRMHLTVVPSEGNQWRGFEPGKQPHSPSASSAFSALNRAQSHHHYSSSSSSASSFYSPFSPNVANAPTPVTSATHTPASGDRDMPSSQRRLQSHEPTIDRDSKESEFSSEMSTNRSVMNDEEGVVSVEIESEMDHESYASAEDSDHPIPPPHLNTQHGGKMDLPESANDILNNLHTVLDSYIREKDKEMEEIQRYQMLVEDLQYELTTLRQQQRHNRWQQESDLSGRGYNGRDGKMSEKAMQADLARLREEMKMVEAEYEKIRQRVDEAEQLAAKLATELQQKNDIFAELQAENASYKEKWQSMRNLASDVKPHQSHQPHHNSIGHV